jgi:hypothetical protein
MQREEYLINPSTFSEVQKRLPIDEGRKMEITQQHETIPDSFPRLPKEGTNECMKSNIELYTYSSCKIATMQRYFWEGL